MISVDEALTKVLDVVRPVEAEKVYMTEAVGRILFEDIYSPLDNPLWDNSAMDGFAVRCADLSGCSVDNPVKLRVTEVIPAGGLPSNSIGKGEAHQIMTGAPVHATADAVIKKEETEFDGTYVTIRRLPVKGENIRYKGENFKKGDRVMKRGDVISPGHVALSASIGTAFLPVSGRPVVGILSTGDELAEAGAAAGNKKIYDSNSYALSALVSQAGGIPRLLGIAKDKIEDIEAKIKAGLNCDMLLVSGGVSVGNFDYVKDAFNNIGVELGFWKVAMRPGNPLAFGTMGNKLVFGLPGNPVSAMVIFDQFVRPAILKMSGAASIFKPKFYAGIVEDLDYKKGLKYFLRGFAWMEKGELFCRLAGSQSSGNLLSMVMSNCIIIKPEDRECIKAGEKVEINLQGEVLDQN